MQSVLHFLQMSKHRSKHVIFTVVR